MAPESRTTRYFRVAFVSVFASVPIESRCNCGGYDVICARCGAGVRVGVKSGATPARCGFRRHQPIPAPAVARRVAPARTCLFAPVPFNRTGPGATPGCNTRHHH